MKGWKKWACLLAGMLMAVSMFGCAPQGNGGTTPENPDVSNPELPEPEPEPEPLPGEPETGSPLGLSHESGVYADAFTLTVTRAEESHEVHFTLDGSVPTQDSPLIGGGLTINAGRRNSYPLTDSVQWTSASHGGYYFWKTEGCTIVRLAEMDEEGNVVAEKTATYFIREDGAAFFTLPVISIVLPPEDAAFYNDIENESKTRADFEYFDFANEEHFHLNTQIKVGGNWTKGFPYRTMNVNFNKNENGKKNTPVTVDLFQGRSARDGSELTNFTRFRLHSGGNAQTLNWFGDAFTQRVAAEIPSSDGEFLSVATTGYRPCEVFLNGEYWGMYAIREHYSDVYFAQNYGVDKDDVIMLDRAPNINANDPAYSDDSVFNTTYAFEVGEDTEEETGMQLATEYFDFLYSAELSDPAQYALFEAQTDVDSLIDMVLVHLYAGNWDFMYNNVKMWRTGSVDPENPYADGKWRFCLHDLDFSFEFQWGDNGMEGANGYTLGPNYLDFYLGTCALTYNNLGRISKEMNCLISAPMRNASFRARFLERARVVKEIYNNPRVFQVLNAMTEEVESPMHRHLMRWSRFDYDYSSWLFFVDRTKDVLNWRSYMRDDYGNREAYYPNGNYFDLQIDAAIKRFLG